MNHELAAQVMIDADLKPLVKYPGSGVPWKCRCTRCKKIVTPRYSNIKSGHGGCRSCSKVQVTAEVAVRAMEAVNFRPLEPYPGRTNVKWRCKCLRCKAVSTPRYNTALQGKGCGRCAGFGFNPAKNALVYVLKNDQLASIKIGITEASSNRLKMFSDVGWKTVETYFFEQGHKARTVEKAVLKRIREDLRIPPHLTKADMAGMNGWTETVSANLLAVEAVCSMIRLHLIADSV